MADRRLVLIATRVVERPDSCYNCERFSSNTGECKEDQQGSDSYGYDLTGLHAYIVSEQLECCCIWMAAVPG